MKSKFIRTVLTVGLICLVIFLPEVKAQTGITYISIEYPDLIDSRYEKVIDTVICESGFSFDSNKTTYGKYFKVEYDYGEPPPSPEEIVKLYLNNQITESPIIYKGQWEIYFNKKDYLLSTEGYNVKYDLTAKNINSKSFFLKYYTGSLYISNWRDFNLTIRGLEATQSELDSLINNLSR